MLITKKHLSRRAVLKGAGVTLALPFLEAMVPAATALRKTAAAPTLRTGFFYLPHGAVQGDTALGPEGDRWTPSGSGETFKLRTTTQPLEPFKKYVTSIGNLENVAGAGGGAQHTLSPATWLSCTRPAGIGAIGGRGGPAPVTATADAFSNPRMSTTLDQVIAGRIKAETFVDSLQVASETSVQQAAGNGSPFTTLSFRDATSPLPMEYNPKKVFHRLFGVGRSPRESAVELDERKSLLDLIQEQTKALQSRLGEADKATLDRYLESVRTAEQQTQQQLQSQALGAKRLADIEKNPAGVMIPDPPVGPLDRFDEQVQLMFNLIALAYQADLTRVVSFLMVAEGSNQTYGHIGVPDSFHPISHHANELDKITRLVKIQTWHMSAFASFLKTIAETQDGDGTLLDHSIFLYGSNMGNSDKHSSWPIPTAIVGGGNGAIKMGGRHIAPRDKTPLANVHLTLLNKVGIEQKSFADSTGVILEL